jgi:hypothetical protein
MTFEPSKPMPEWTLNTGLHPDDAFVVNLLTDLHIRYIYSKSRRERALIQQISVLVQDLEFEEPERVREAISKLRPWEGA